MPVITAVETFDIRFPTSLSLDGSDAMNPDPDYSAAYVVIRSDAPDGLEGHGFVFTIGRGNDVEVAAIEALRDHLLSQDLDALLDDMGATSRLLAHDSQLRWLGPEKGVMHMAIGAVLNALWDLRAKRAGVPLWLHLCRLSPAEIVSLVDFRYLTDALTPDEALEILPRAEPHREERIASSCETGFPAYTTSPGWLGYSDEKLARLCREAVADGFTQIKLKVGADLDDDDGGCASPAPACRKGTRSRSTRTSGGMSPRRSSGSTRSRSSTWHGSKSRRAPTTSSVTPRSRAASHPIRVATGEHVQNRVVFKQLLQAGGVDIMQIDATRVGGVNENIANLLLAAKFGIPVCPHAGGVGLCEAVQHLSMFDFVAVSGSMRGPDDRVRRPPARALRHARRDARAAAISPRWRRAPAPRCTARPSPTHAWHPVESEVGA